MAKDIEVKVDAEKLARALAEVPGALYRTLKKRLGGQRGYLNMWARTFAVKRFGRGGQGKMGGMLQRRTGTFSRAFGSLTHGGDVKSLRFLTGTVNQEVPYAFIREYGGKVEAKSGGCLTIPLSAAKNASGVARGPARSFQNTSFRKIKADAHGPRWLLMQGDKALFLLLKQVDIPARLGFFDAWTKQLPALVREFNKALDEALKTVEAARD